MITLPEPLFFQWDAANGEKNERKHGVSYKEAEEVFVNEPKFLFPDEKHSRQEKRYGMYGTTSSGRRLSLVFTIRKNIVRVITVRPMSRKERRAYEKIKKDSSL